MWRLPRNHLQLAFESRELRAICEIDAEGRRALGRGGAEVLKRRLADLRAAESLQDLLAGSPRIVENDAEPHLIVYLAGGYVLRLVPNHPIVAPRQCLGGDWTMVRRLKIISISKE